MHWLVVFALCGAPAGGGLTPEALHAGLTSNGSANYHPVVDYDLDASLDPPAKTVTATGHLTWTNTTNRPVSDLWWHLYLNAFRNDRSTFMIESDGGKLRGDEFERGQWGWIEVTKLAAHSPCRPNTACAPSASTDLLAGRTFEHPDDDNADDRTVMRTPLSFAIKPGESITLDLAFTAKLPKVFARSGYSGDPLRAGFFMVAQWFPKLGVLQEVDGLARWNCHQYHSTSEFFADYGNFHVTVRVPEHYKVGATGKRVSEGKDSGVATYVYQQDRVHDFAWTADPRFLEVRRDFVAAHEVTGEEAQEAATLLGLRPEEVALRDVSVTLLISPSHAGFIDRYFTATFNALKWFGLWYGAYPYDVLTVVDGPRGAGGAMGMEYPTLFAGGSRWPTPTSVASPEGVTVHEFGHQFWYGLVGSNEFEEAWLDEGFNTYSTGKVLDRAWGPFAMPFRLFDLPLTPWLGGLHIDSAQGNRVRWQMSPANDAVVRPAWQYRDALSYGVNSYPRTGLVLRQLENEIGPATLARAMRLFQLRWRYRHPSTRDFIATVEEVAGRPLTDYFARTIFTAGAVDYAVSSLESKVIATPAGVFDAATPGVTDHPTVEVKQAAQTDEDKGDEAKHYKTVVFVERRGEVDWPVDIEVSFEDGSHERASWDGKYRWKKFEWVSNKPATDARLYPDGNMLLDLNTTNDSRLKEKSRLPGATWGAHVLYLAQTLWQILGALL